MTSPDSARATQIEAHLPLVRATLSRIVPQVPSGIDEEDLFSAGAMGLIAAVDSFDPSRGAAFETWAITKIRAAIREALRGAGAKPETVSLEDTDEEQVASDLPDPFSLVLAAEQKRLLSAAVASLPERLCEVVRLYYHEGMTFTEIGDRLGVSSQFAGRLHQQALVLLYEALAQDADMLVDAPAIPGSDTLHSAPGLARKTSHAR